MRLSVGTFRKGYSTFKNSRFLRLLHKTRYVTVPAVVVAGVAGLAMLINVSPIGRYVFRAVTDSSAQGNSSVLFVIFSNLLYIAGVLLLIALALYVFIDYRQHRKPLKVAVADARYGVVHSPAPAIR